MSTSDDFAATVDASVLAVIRKERPGLVDALTTLVKNGVSDRAIIGRVDHKLRAHPEMENLIRSALAGLRAELGIPS